MKRMTNSFKRWFSLLMSVVMIATQLQLPVYAEGTALQDDTEELITEEKGDIAYAVDDTTYGDYVNKDIEIVTGNDLVKVSYGANPIVVSSAANHSYIGILYARQSDNLDFFPGSISVNNITGYSFTGMGSHGYGMSEVWLDDLSVGTYMYRIVIAKEDEEGHGNIVSYHFITEDPGTFTCGDAPEYIESAEVVEYGYDKETVRLSLNPQILDDNEQIEELYVMTDNSIERYYPTRAYGSLDITFDTAYAEKVTAVAILHNTDSEEYRLSNSVTIMPETREPEEATVKIEMGAGTQSLSFNATVSPFYSSDVIWAGVKIREKNSEDWSDNSSNILFDQYGDGSYKYVFNKLKPDTEYEWYAEITTQDRVVILATRGTDETPNTIKTLPDEDLTADQFNNAALYAYLSSNLFLGHLNAEKLTRAVLESCNYLVIDRTMVEGLNDISDIPVFFPNLRRVDFSDQDISDVSPLMELPELTDINLKGNDIESFPEGFFEILCKAEIDWKHNLLPSESYNYQDTLEIKIDSRQYTSGVNKQLYFTFGHGNYAKDYNIYLSIDGGEDQLVTNVARSSTPGTDANDVYYYADRYFLVTDISALLGDKTRCNVKVTVKTGETTLASGSADIYYDDIESLEKLSGENYFTLGTIYIPNKFFTGDIPASVSVSVRDTAGKVYAEQNCIVYEDSSTELHEFSYNSQPVTACRGYYVCPIYTTYDGTMTEALKPGSYDIVISSTGENGQVIATFTNKIKAVEGAYISNAVVDRTIDNRGDFIYIYTYVKNADPEKIWPVIKSLDGTVKYTSGVASAEIGYANSGEMTISYKLKKGANWSSIQNADDDTQYLLDFETADGYEWVDGRETTYKKVTAWSLKDVSPYDLLYVYYNIRKKGLEIFGPADLAGKAFSIKTETDYTDYTEQGEQIDYYEAATGNGKFDDNGYALVTMKGSDGKVYLPSHEGHFAYYQLTVDGKALDRKAFNDMHPWEYGTVREMTADEAKAWACVLGVCNKQSTVRYNDGYLRFYSENTTGPYTVSIFEKARTNAGAVKTITFTADKFDANGKYTFTETDLTGLKADEVYYVYVRDANGYDAFASGFITDKYEANNNDKPAPTPNPQPVSDDDNNNPTPAPAPAPDAPLHSISVVEGATAKNSAGKEVTNAKENETISISWTEKADYSFVKWDLTGATPKEPVSANTIFVMGKEDVIVSYEEKLKVDDQVLETLPADADRSVKVTALKFDSKKLTLQKGSKKEFKVNVKAADGAAPKIYYVTKNKDIVA
ncbi:MAG: hypothetical protein K6B44_05345, partial [Lachnospiraceae bacterium]|nr:hypothetical protein [Lachnospiraceae bacterium]